MKHRQLQNRSSSRSRSRASRRAFAHSRALVEVTVAIGVLSLSVLSAMMAKSAGHAPALAALERASHAEEPTPAVLATNSRVLETITLDPEPVEPDEPAGLGDGVEVVSDEPYTGEPEIRWFNDRPIRPARTLIMRVTAYSPDERSCGIYADGQTATLHSVSTNGGALVAADPRVLPYGSLLTIPGYDRGRVVPVLDCGGKIKGHRLDVLYPTHRRALRWGVQDLAVTVWEYADGLPADNPRALR